MRPISITHGARLFTRTAEDRLIARLRPFILQAAKEIASRGQIRDAILKTAQEYKELAAYFDIEAETLEQNFGLRKEYLFPKENSPIEEFMFRRSDGKGQRLSLKSSRLLPELRNLLFLCGCGRYTEKQISRRLPEPMPELLAALLQLGAVTGAAPKKLTHALRRPAVYRLQHASLLYRTETTGVLVDPHLHSEYEPSRLNSNVLRRDLEDRVDAILISHSHADHWNLATLMTFSPSTLIVVPKVPRVSLLAEDMQTRLQSLGFTNVVAVDWYSKPLIVGDVEIHVLPFYGEQPLMSGQPRHPDLRNWGNTYFIKTPFYSSWFLIDSGDDDLGAALDVARHVKEKLGGTDFLLSNLRVFQPFTPLYITGGHYWLALPTRILREFSSIRHHSLTLGPKMVAKACEVSGARYYLPYAHMFGSLGEHGSDNELGLINQLDKSLKEIHGTTAVVPWRIGEGCTLAANGRLERLAPPDRH